jgi:hypothetical protein
MLLAEAHLKELATRLIRTDPELSRVEIFNEFSEARRTLHAMEENREPKSAWLNAAIG